MRTHTFSPCIPRYFLLQNAIRQALQRLHLDDNRIESVERRAFMNLDKLRHLSLRGNKLTSISDEAFQVRGLYPLQIARI